MAKSAIYPGTFDPVTFGHLDLIGRATEIFDNLIVAVARNGYKNPLFTLEERVAMLKEATRNIDNLTVVAFDGLVVEFARQQKVNVLIRGLRMFSDFEYEFQMALTNRRLAADIQTVFLMPSESYSFLSSALIKETAELGADISSFVPDFVARKLKEKRRP
ncbi:MAG TPA: pantetheine-phosphate adenylyltransferase [Candidatus Omnitrophota bacterium]|nr:pantetheine-phosphate adenylyltransferase [Candidatus Omnitrophota bacterium]HPB68998.1 pantetheine-phosphate adenylyltransferase [Candidatus Omnitrophota bacterium]HQO58947.1 pantetheine-phosphate adenylyltransferase [Candidatus Omnitrophota bacterium]HQP11975.1 pantetheine-phosphate adenylyltransferase [Candidatus Omnitrophota bacterium]